ncbi:MAG: redoxin domain-containing protein [Bacteroidales bacterium]|nr:redoxin domain-containing protein [Bacteroidales bacterium]
MKNALWIVLLACFACSKPSIRIEGNLKNLPDGKVYLSILDSTLQHQYIDTTNIVEGKFAFDYGIELTTPECVFIKFSNAELPIIMGNDHVTIEGDFTKPTEISIKGSESNDIMEKFYKEIPERNTIDRLNVELQSAVNDVDRRNEIIDEIKKALEEQNAYIKQFINSHAGQSIGVICLLNSSIIQLYEYEELDSLLKTMQVSLPNNKYVNALANYMNMRRSEYEAQKALEIGKVAPDFELPTIDGNTVKLSSLRGKENGKTVLLDFWASWCKPCRNNNKTLVEVYDKFADKGLEIVSVSLDTQSAEWRKAVKEDNLKGIQMIDSTNVIAVMYCISSIPCCYLIDTEGVIRAKDIGENKGIIDEIAAILK